MPTPAAASIVKVESAQQMYDAIVPLASHYDIYIGAAAVADYRPAQIEQQKIKKQGDNSIIRLQRNQDIIAAVAQLEHKPFVVGFAAETHNLESYAQNKLCDKNMDMIAANLVGQKLGGFDSDLNALQVFWKHGQKMLAMTNKQHLAEQLIELIAERLDEKNTA